MTIESACAIVSAGYVQVVVPGGVRRRRRAVEDRGDAARRIDARVADDPRAEQMSPRAGELLTGVTDGADSVPSTIRPYSQMRPPLAVPEVQVCSSVYPADRRSSRRDEAAERGQEEHAPDRPGRGQRDGDRVVVVRARQKTPPPSLW